VALGQSCNTEDCDYPFNCFDTDVIDQYVCL
jgi:hypothetical protein